MAYAHRNIALWIVIAVLCYFLAEAYFNWPPLQFALGGFVLELRHLVFALLCLFIGVRLYFVLTKEFGSQK
jgi:hypothetical protein